MAIRPIYEESPALRQARAAFLREDFAASLRLFEKALKRQPHNLLALTDAARAFGQRFDCSRAERCVERMRDLAGSDPGVLLLAAQSLRMAHRRGPALDLLLEAERRPGVPPLVLLELAALLERLHRLPEALDRTRSFLHAFPGNSEARLLEARLLRRMGDKDGAVTVYQGLSGAAGCAPVTRAQALNEWAQLLDAGGEFDAAWDTLLRSKGILLGQPPATDALRQGEREGALLDRFLASLTAGYLANWSSCAPATDHTPVLLTGCPRSGTTLIEKILDAHSSIVTADEFEVFPNAILPDLLRGRRESDGSFTAETLEGIPLDRLRMEEARAIRMLEEAMGEAVGDRTLIDKNPSLTFLLPAVLRVWPQARILYALRDPRDVALSCFFRWLPVNRVSARFLRFEDTCRRTAEELAAWVRLREILPPARWLETRYEETVSDHQAEAARVTAWLGLPAEATDHLAHLRARGVNSPTYEAVSEPVHSRALGRWSHYRERIEEHLPHLVPAMDRLGY